MTVKLIAVDMDGTFLRDDKTYHRERFLKQYAEMKARGIRFVVASGNQYYQLTSFFRTSPTTSPSWRKTARGWYAKAKMSLTAS